MHFLLGASHLNGPEYFVRRQFHSWHSVCFFQCCLTLTRKDASAVKAGLYFCFVFLWLFHQTPMSVCAGPTILPEESPLFTMEVIELQKYKLQCMCSLFSSLCVAVAASFSMSDLCFSSLGFFCCGTRRHTGSESTIMVSWVKGQMLQSGSENLKPKQFEIPSKSLDVFRLWA